MKLHVPMGHVLSHGCLAGACVALLATAAHRMTYADAPPAARNVAPARLTGLADSPRHAQSPGGTSPHTRPAADEADSLPATHPLGFSSDGEPDIRSRHSLSVALAPQPHQ
jgi:hypothetical protein